TRKQGKQLWHIIKKHSNADQLIPESPKQRESPPLKRQEYSSGALKILALFPNLLTISFIISFFWDFDGISITLYSYTLHFDGLLKIVSVSGLIGFLTNWVAITMLFKPAQKRPILGHGLIPAQKDRIAYRLGQAVSEDLINPEIIKK